MQEILMNQRQRLRHSSLAPILNILYCVLILLNLVNRIDVFLCNQFEKRHFSADSYNLDQFFRASNIYMGATQKTNFVYDLFVSF